jgi:hypothetical protein
LSTPPSNSERERNDKTGTEEVPAEESKFVIKIVYELDELCCEYFEFKETMIVLGIHLCLDYTTSFIFNPIILTFSVTTSASAKIRVVNGVSAREVTLLRFQILYPNVRLFLQYDCYYYYYFVLIPQ